MNTTPLNATVHVRGTQRLSKSPLLPGGGGGGGGGGHDLAKFRVPMIHRFMTSHPVAELLLCFRAKHNDGRPMLFGFLVIFTHRLAELCILNAENIKKVYSRPFKQMS